MITYSLPIVAIKQETEDTVTVCFKQPGLKKIRYKAGQYLTLIIRINGRRYIRPYSFSSTFGIDSTINVTIKRVLGGIVSNHIIDTVKVGDNIEVLPPMGDFIVNEEQRLYIKHLVLWGVGSGITPLFSILKDNLINSDVHITLVYGNRKSTSIIFTDELRDLYKDHPHRLSIFHFHTQPALDPTQTHIFSGRIDPIKVLGIIKTAGALENSAHYICGPLGLKESVKAALTVAGVDRTKVYSEDFEVIKNPEDFVDIHTRNIQIQQDSEMYVVEVVKGKSILEAGLDLGLEMDYACQTGNCSVCKGRLIKGEVRTIGIGEVIKEISTDEYLLCCTYPVSDDVIVKV